MGILIAILIGALAGWLAGRIMGSRQGLLVNIALGVLGAVIGNGILRFVFGTTAADQAAGLIGQIIVAILGACLLIAVVRAVRR